MEVSASLTLATSLSTKKPSSTTPNVDNHNNRKRRLSRKEQKARKKKQKREESQQQPQKETAKKNTTKIIIQNNKSEKKNNNNDDTQETKQQQQQQSTVKNESNNNGSHEDTNNSSSNDPFSSINYDHSYVPTPIPPNQDKFINKQKSLGKWFPKAKVMKSKSSPSSSKNNNDKNNTATQNAALVLFYQYVQPPWPESRVEHLMAFLSKIGTSRILGGRIRVAPEGVNATISSLDDGLSKAVETLYHFAKDLQQFDKIFQQTHFKYMSGLSSSRHFKDFKILPVKELVYYGLNETQAPLEKGGVHLSPTDFHDMLAQDETVVVDVRNHYEAAIGRFDGQEQQQEQQCETTDKKSSTTTSSSQATTVAAATTAAKYIDPKMRKSTDFPTWLQKPETTEMLQNKNVLLYCTGGVRCERASAFLNTQMGDKVKGVYQLKGGIENYLQTFKDGGFWRGKNFVFDKREAIDANNLNGDGGVVTKKKKKNQQQSGGAISSSCTSIQTFCCVCDKPWDRYVGKKKCETCGVPVLMCDSCMSQKKEKSSLPPLSVRCPLCKEEGVTVKVDDVEYTNNGVTGVVVGNNNDDEIGQCNKNHKKAAPSVLKWGGGHASEKKQKRLFKRTPCRFGTDCIRKDCMFAHPERDRKKQQK